MEHSKIRHTTLRRSAKQERLAKLSLGHPLVWVAFVTAVSLFGTLQRPPTIPINLTYVTFVLLLLVFGSHLAVNKAHLTFVWTRSDKLVLMMIAIVIFTSLLASLFYGYPLNLWQSEGLALFGTFGLYFITRFSVQKKEHIYWLLGFLLLALFIQFSFSLFVYFLNPEQGVFPGLEDVDVAQDTVHAVSNEARLTGLLLNPNNFATLPAMAVPLFFAFYLIPKHTRYRWWLALGTGLSLVVLFFSFSRSAWIGAGVATLLLLWILRQHLLLIRVRSIAKILITLIVVSLILGSVFNQLSNTNLWRLIELRATSLSQQEAQGNRLDMWGHAAYMIKDHPAGVGLGNSNQVWFQTDSPFQFSRARNLHNSVIAFVVQNSLLAGAIFLWLFLIFPINAMRQTKTEDPTVKIVAWGLSVALLSFWIHTLAHTVHTHNIAWVLLACLVSLQQIADRDRAFKNVN